MAKHIDLTGKKFGMLTVIKEAEKDGRYIMWYCDCDCGTKGFIVRGHDLNLNKVKSCGCKKLKDINAEEKANSKPKPKRPVIKMSEKEIKEWDDLYQYVKNEIMGYDENQALSSTMALRLKGLLTNKFIENNNTESTANYSYETILNTFKFCSPDIKRALRTNNFKDEMHRFNFILKIVERNINDVYLRMKSVEKAKEDAENTIVDTVEYTGAEYQKKTIETNNKLLNDLW